MFRSLPYRAWLSRIIARPWTQSPVANAAARKTGSADKPIVKGSPYDGWVAYFHFENPKAIRYQGGRLYYLDGQAQRSVSLEQSLQIYVNLFLKGNAMDVVEDFDGKAREKWIKQIRLPR